MTESSLSVGVYAHMAVRRGVFFPSQFRIPGFACYAGEAARLYLETVAPQYLAREGVQYNFVVPSGLTELNLTSSNYLPESTDHARFFSVRHRKVLLTEYGFNRTVVCGQRFSIVTEVAAMLEELASLMNRKDTLFILRQPIGASVEFNLRKVFPDRHVVGISFRFPGFVVPRAYIPDRRAS